MAKFKKRPIVIEAIQWNGKNYPEIIIFFDDKISSIHSPIHKTISIPTLEGTMAAYIGDWIIKGVNGEFYPCKPDIFEQTYEKA